LTPKTVSDLAIRFVKSKLFGPKDYFERQKKRLVRSMIIPLIAFVGAPSLIVAVLSSFRYVNFEGQGVILQLIGEASNDVLIIASSLVAAFCFGVGANLLYGFRLKRFDEKLAELQSSEEARNSFEQLQKKYHQYIENKEPEKAIALGSYICRSFPEESRLDPIFITSLVDVGAEAELLTLESPTPKRTLALEDKSEEDS
jgi:hypothetical protein